MTEQARFTNTLTSAVAGLGLSLKTRHLDLMWRHFLLMIEANRQFNLTRITAPADAAVKHYADSLTLLATAWADRGRPLTLLDVGTGAGFPAVPLAILCDNWQVTAIDGTGKKARFVGEVAEALSLRNLTARQSRAADLARQGGQTFDLITFRAVTQLAPGVEEVYPLVSAAGAVVFYKSGTLGDLERTAGEAAARRRGLSAVDVQILQLATPNGPIDRRLIRYARRG